MYWVLLTALVVIWLNIGILSAKSMDELDGAAPLEEMILPLRLIVILLAPLAMLAFERHLFYSKENLFNNN